jgi:biofilm protein TabA
MILDFSFSASFVGLFWNKTTKRGSVSRLSNNEGEKMIVDRIESLGKYQLVIPYLAEVIDFIADGKLDALPTGSHPIVDDLVRVSVSEYETKDEASVKWEAHRKFIDVQIVLSGSESIGHSDVADLTVVSGYDEKGDFSLYADEGTALTSIALKPGMFCAFFPEDGHKPGCAIASPAKVRKAVFKIPV